MSTSNCFAVIVFYALTLDFSSVFAQHSGLSGFSPSFLSDYESAQKKIEQEKSVDPLVALLEKYTTEREKTELEVSIGLAYNQRSGVVNPAKAVLHFTTALQYDKLPERTYMEILMWRGGSQEQLQNSTEALKDYLRGLLACSYYDLSGGWPEIQSPMIPIFTNSPDPENGERIVDYNRYRKNIDFQQFLLSQRYFLIEGVNRVAKEQSINLAKIMEMLKALSPDSSRFNMINDWLKSENKRPWP